MDDVLKILTIKGNHKIGKSVCLQILHLQFFLHASREKLYHIQETRDRRGKDILYL